jgi:tRNA(Ile)-lysidine synthase
VALAHTQDDAAETVLMNILRGSGLQGLRGIVPARKEGDTTIIRPLLETSKKQILKFLSSSQLSFRIDQTNRQTVYARNRIRYNLLPYLEKNFNPQIRKLLAQLSHNLTADYNFIREEAQKLVRTSWFQKNGFSCQIPMAAFKNIPESMRHMILRLIWENLTGTTTLMTTQHLKEMLKLASQRPTGSIVYLPKKIFMKKTDKMLVIGRRKT